MLPWWAWGLSRPVAGRGRRWWRRTCACGNSCWYCDDGSCGLASATEIDVFGSWRADGSRAGKTSSSSCVVHGPSMPFAATGHMRGASRRRRLCHYARPDDDVG
jgi:hypothetical protein